MLFFRLKQSQILEFGSDAMLGIISCYLIDHMDDIGIKTKSWKYEDNLILSVGVLCRHVQLHQNLLDSTNYSSSDKLLSVMLFR